MSGTLILEILLGVLVLICAVITNAALWPIPPRSQTADPRRPSAGETAGTRHGRGR